MFVKLSCPSLAHSKFKAEPGMVLDSFGRLESDCFPKQSGAVSASSIDL